MQSTDIYIHPALSLLGILNLLGAAQGVLLAIALLTSQSGNTIANRLLATLTLTISIVVSGAVLLTSDYVFVYPHLSSQQRDPSAAPPVLKKKPFVALR